MKFVEESQRQAKVPSASSEPASCHPRNESDAAVAMPQHFPGGRVGRGVDKELLPKSSAASWNAFSSSGDFGSRSPMP